jgi:hypothetical protein
MPEELTRYESASHFANDSNFEVQRANHFEVVIDLPQSLADAVPDVAGASRHLRLSTKSISAPKVSADQITLKHGNDTVKVAAAPSYEDLTLTVHDTLGTDQVDLVQSWFNLVFDNKTRLMGLSTKYKSEGTLYMYAPDGSMCRKWHLHGVWPKDFGQSGDFSFDDAGTAQSISITLSVDRFEEEKSKTPIGS